MPLIRRKRRTHTMILARLEESILTLRHLQRQGQPGAEVSLNICLEQWQTAWDRLVLQAYENWAQTPGPRTTAERRSR